jgi:hypothetical protein
MAIKASGSQLKFSEIVAEFGNPTENKFGNYRVDQQLNTNSDTADYKEARGIEIITLDAGIPSPGEPIKFSDFYGKRLNLIVDFYNHPMVDIPLVELTKNISFTVYRQGDGVGDMLVTFTAQDGSGSFTITNKSSNGEKSEIRTVKKNVTYNVVFTEPGKTTQNGLIASSSALASTASDNGSYSKGGRILKLVAGTSRKAFGDQVGSGNDRDDMQITVKEGIFTSGTGTRINQNGTPVVGAVDGFAGTENQRVTRPLTYTYTESISTTQALLRKNIKFRYSDSSTIVVGGFKSRPEPAKGNKVIAFVNQTIGSEKGNINNVALRTGTWDTTSLELIIGASGRIYGSGGNGGNSGTSTPTAGANGTSALGIDYPTAIINRGYIQAGFGGGGGGSYKARNVTINSGKKNAYNEYNVSSGGGGGGGVGLPPGNGGTSGGKQGSQGTAGSAGSPGGLESKGTGAIAGEEAGDGGDGGQPPSTDAIKGIDKNETGGSAGTTGYAIIFYNGGGDSPLTNVGTIYPSSRYLYNTNPT